MSGLLGWAQGYLNSLAVFYAARRPAYGLDYDDAPQADLDLGPHRCCNACSESPPSPGYKPGPAAGPGPRARLRSTTASARTAGRAILAGNS